MRAFSGTRSWYHPKHDVSTGLRVSSTRLARRQYPMQRRIAAREPDSVPGSARCPSVRSWRIAARRPSR
eukprot:3267900-Rhodomonas_salina.2